MARRDTALENIRSLMESQEVEWLDEHGFDPVPHKPEPRRPAAPKKPLSGQFAANRFLGTDAPEPQAPQAGEPSDSVEIVEVIKQKDNRHSWLYNEVVKAIHDASGDGKKTKVIAIFIPVVQNGKEFTELPVSESIELSPVDEEAVTLEDLTSTPDEDETLPPAPSLDKDGEHDDVAQPLIPNEQPEQEPEPEITSPEPEHDEQVGDLLPGPEHEPDEELAQAFIDMEAKLDEDIAAEAQELPDIEELTESDEPVIDATDAIIEEAIDEADDEILDDTVGEENVDVFADVDEPEDYSAGETLAFTEIPLPNDLDDEELDDTAKN